MRGRRGGRGVFVGALVGSFLASLGAALYVSSQPYREESESKDAIVQDEGPCSTPLQLTVPGSYEQRAEKLKAMGYRGVVRRYDGRPIKDAVVSLLGTSCRLVTDDSGVFDFGTCDPELVARLLMISVLVEVSVGDVDYGGGRSGCTPPEVVLLAPPYVNDIVLDFDGDGCAALRQMCPDRKVSSDYEMPSSREVPERKSSRITGEVLRKIAPAKGLRDGGRTLF